MTANAHLRSMSASQTWHPTYIRFGDDSIKTPRQPIDRQRRLRASDIAVIDIGPVWNGYEGDFGDTFVFGDRELHHPVELVGAFYEDILVDHVD